MVCLQDHLEIPSNKVSTPARTWNTGNVTYIIPVLPSKCQPFTKSHCYLGIKKCFVTQDADVFYTLLNPSVLWLVDDCDGHCQG